MNNRRPLFQSTIKPSSFSKVWRRLQRWRRYSIWPLVLHTKKVSSSYQMSWWCWLHERIKERSIWITWWAVAFCLCHDQIYPIFPIFAISKCPPLLYWQLIGGQFLKSSPPQLAHFYTLLVTTDSAPVPPENLMIPPQYIPLLPIPPQASNNDCSLRTWVLRCHPFRPVTTNKLTTKTLQLLPFLHCSHMRSWFFLFVIYLCCNHI